MAERPAFVTDAHLDYLDALRESGITNMFGAAPYLKNAYGMHIAEARETLRYWMETFPREPQQNTKEQP